MNFSTLSTLLMGHLYFYYAKASKFDNQCDPGFQPNDLDSSPGHSLDGSFRKSRSGLYMFSSLYGIQCS